MNNQKWSEPLAVSLKKTLQIVRIAGLLMSNVCAIGLLANMPCAAETTSSVAVYELRGLRNSYASKGPFKQVSPSKREPDATVLMSKNFSPNAPVRVVFYNHGLGDSSRSTLLNSALVRQMRFAHANTILVIPEWQARPGDVEHYTGGPSTAYAPNFIREQLREILMKLPSTKSKKLEDIDSFGIITHSGGYFAANFQLRKNSFGDKVTSLTILDSMYEPGIYDQWIEENARALQSGRKRLIVIYTKEKTTNSAYRRHDRTMPSWVELFEDHIKAALKRGGVSNPNHLIYKDDYPKLADAGVLSRCAVVFKRDNSHLGMTQSYVGKVLQMEKNIAANSSPKAISRAKRI